MTHVGTTGEDMWQSKVLDITPPNFVPDENNTDVARQEHE